MAQSKTAPRLVSKAAQNHFEAAGAGTLSRVLRNASASIPGQVKRYAIERHAAWAIWDRTRHHVSHFRLK